MFDPKRQLGDARVRRWTRKGGELSLLLKLIGS